ncbi:MAG: replicative DNA helicase [Mangrovibacterium sp.]
MKNQTKDYQLGQLPPQAIDVEEAILGALMLERDAYVKISDIIDTNSFYKEEHREIFDAIKYLSTHEKPVDLLMVTQELKNRNKLDKVGGPLYITQLTSRVASAAHIEFHARIIAQTYFQREIIRLSNEATRMAFEGEDVDVLGLFWRKSIDDLENIFTIADSGTLFNIVLKSTIQSIEQDCTCARSNHTPGIPSGFTSFDDSTGGFRNGNLIILAARPGVGKTSFALHFALTAAKAGFWINFFSLEMNKEDLTRIVLATESGIYRSDIRDGYLKEKDWKTINNAIPRIENLPIIFRDASGMTVNQIQGAIRKNRKNGRCDFAIIDYLQLVRPTDTRAIREQQIAEISRTLKTTSLNENIPIMALSQLNRAADGEQPKLSHLRESGAIEQDADLVCFLHHPEESKDIIRLTIAKHRRGRLGEIDIFSNGEMTRFSEDSTFNISADSDYYPNRTIEPQTEPF